VGLLNGGDTGESDPWSVVVVSTALGGGERGCGGLGVWCWTPCWVLKEQAPVACGSSGWLRLVIKLLSPGGVVCGGGGWAWFRCLRIAQWTRASDATRWVVSFVDVVLWSSCRGQTVDAWAPGADEGRGRPR
jgi:hypothetical protein